MGFNRFTMLDKKHDFNSQNDVIKLFDISFERISVKLTSNSEHQLHNLSTFLKI
jgi:hypothetical protein